MSQAEVIQFLSKRKGKWFTVKQVSKGMNKSNGMISSNITKLRQKNMVIHRFIEECRTNEYKYKSEVT